MSSQAGCVFCKIINGELPTTLIHYDEDYIAFEDLHPQAPVHLLVVPRKHIESLAEVELGDDWVAGGMMKIARMLADEYRVSERGYRVVMNVGREGGQTVPHMHLHVLGGQNMGEKSI